MIDHCEADIRYEYALEYVFKEFSSSWKDTAKAAWAIIVILPAVMLKHIRGLTYKLGLILQSNPGCPLIALQK